MSWLSDPAVRDAVRVSLAVASRSVAIDALPAVALAWALSRRFRLRPLLDVAVHLPLVLPPVVTGWLLLLVLGPHGPVGAALLRGLGLRLAFTTDGAAIAAAAMSLPLVVRAIRLGFEALDPRLLASAASLGAAPLDRAFTVALPLLAPFVLAGLTTGFAASLGEFGAVITFAADIPGRTETLPTAIYVALQEPGGDALAARLATISGGLALVGLLVSDVLSRRLARAVSGVA